MNTEPTITSALSQSTTIECLGDTARINVDITTDDRVTVTFYSKWTMLMSVRIDVPALEALHKAIGTMLYNRKVAKS